MVNEVKIPMTSLEDWFILYQLMQNRDSKISMIENYLLAHKIEHIEILKQWLEYNIPSKVKLRISKLIENLNSRSYKLDVSQLKKGTYILNLKIDDFTVSRKLVIGAK